MNSVSNFIPFEGCHCETTATGNLLQHAGLQLSEPMIFGLGSGIGYGVFQFKGMATPFIGGRSKPEEVTKALCEVLKIDVEFKTTRSTKRAWENVASFIDAGQPVAVKLDAFYLDYFDIDFHYAGHFLTAHGYDDEFVYVVDTNQQGHSLKTSRESFEEARLWKGPMASNAMTWTIDKIDKDIDFPPALKTAIVTNATSYLNPPIRNFGAKGINKTSKMMLTWMDSIENPVSALAQLGGIMERAGTGGGLFRYMYSDFLKEANEYLKNENVKVAATVFFNAAEHWRTVSQILEDASCEGLQTASDMLLEIAELEESAMTKLANL